MKKRRLTTKKTLFDSFDQVEEELHQPLIGIRVLLGILLVTVILLGIVWQKVNVTELAQDIEALKKERQKLEERIGELNSEVLKLSDGKRIVKIAEDKLDMIFPDTEVLPMRESFQKNDLNE